MPENPKPRSRVTFNVVAICFIVIAAFAVKPLKIMYHHRGMWKAWGSSFQQSKTNSTDVADFERHRNRLVALGYYSQQIFNLERVKSHSPEHRTLFEALSRHATSENGFYSMQGFETNAKSMVIVWALPSKIQGWSDLIQKHEQQVKEPQTK
ncbi:MAG: hypothetical protein EXS31_10865 [Pedosphaera sp.]|nr:hypothetical protein [Pedosphaera sp.]